MYASPLTSRVAVINADEVLTDLLQFELEQVGLAATAFVPQGWRCTDTLIEFVTKAAPTVCLFGAGRPYRESWPALQQLRMAQPACHFVVITAAPWALTTWLGREPDLLVLREYPDPIDTVTVAVPAVRHSLVLTDLARFAARNVGTYTEDLHRYEHSLLRSRSIVVRSRELREQAQRLRQGATRSDAPTIRAIKNRAG